MSLQAIERFDAETTTLAQTLPDYSLFRALPGAVPLSHPGCPPPSRTAVRDAPQS